MSTHDWTRNKTARAASAVPKRRTTGRDAGQAGELIQRKESCACGGSCPACQAKTTDALAVSRAGDASEVEADRVADRVVRGDSVSEQVRAAPDSGAIAPAADGTAVAAASGATGRAIRSSRGSGQAMDAQTQSTMSSRFGHDFSAVRVHADSLAAGLSEQLNARAFTVGNDVYFGRGRFDPASGDGARLLAHELTHVVQQGAGSSELLQRDIDDEADEQVAGTMAAPTEDVATDTAPAFDEMQGEEADTLQQGGRCNAESNKHFLLANSVPFEFTVPAGCRATVTFSALWVPVDGNECCTGADTYSVTRNGGTPRNLRVGPNICEGEHTPRTGSISTGSGRQRFNVQTDRLNCTGIKMQLDVNIRIR